MVKKRGLGKGLAALIPDMSIIDSPEGEENTDRVKKIDIDLIIANKEQPRKRFEKEALQELSESLRQHGIIQPLVVRKLGHSYEIVVGERRWRAAKLAEFQELPCIVRDLDDKQVLKLALIENLQREDLNPIEEARALKGLLEDHGITQEEAAKAIGKSRSYLANSIRLLNLEDEIKAYVAEGKITSGHARALLSIPGKGERLKAAKAIMENKINVRETEKLAKGTVDKTPKAKGKHKDPYAEEVEDKLMRTLGTKVSLSFKKEKGMIQIEFYGNDDLQRLLDLIV